MSTTPPPTDDVQTVQPQPIPPMNQPRGRRLSKRHFRQGEAYEFAHKATLGNPRYRDRVFKGLEEGTLHPMLEKTFIELAYGKSPSRADLLKEALGEVAAMGLIRMVLRSPLNVDPLAEAVVVGSGTTSATPTPAPALPPRASIVPPSRPRRGTAPPLQPGEEEMPPS